MASKIRGRSVAKPSRSAQLKSDRAALERLTQEIVALKGKTGQALYELGLRLSEVQERELWRAGRHSTFEEYLEGVVDVSRSTAYKLIRIAREFNAAIARDYGVEKLDLGLRYLDSTPAEEQPGDLLAADIRVRDARGRWTSVPFHRAKTRQIREAIALLNDKRAAGRRVGADLEARAQRLEGALPAPPAGVSSGARVRLRRGRDGRTAVTFAAIPLDELDAFLKAVQKHLM